MIRILHDNDTADWNHKYSLTNKYDTTYYTFLSVAHKMLDL